MVISIAGLHAKTIGGLFTWIRSCTNQIAAYHAHHRNHPSKASHTSPTNRNIIMIRILSIACLLLLLHVTPGNSLAASLGASGVGRFVLDQDAATGWQCHYDMVLVERIQGKPKRDTGLFVPDDTLPKLHLCRVLSMGNGREEENGLIAPMPDIQIGDIVVAKNPWGIGPKDEETADGKKLSYMRSQDIAAKITGGLVPEE